MDEIISYKMCAVKVRNAKLRNYLKDILLDTTTHLYEHNPCKVNKTVANDNFLIFPYIL
jgi:hypothetical protein